jgi:hypothetical protein
LIRASLPAGWARLRNYRVLRGKGVTVHKTIDVIIATARIERNFELLHNQFVH